MVSRERTAIYKLASLPYTESVFLASKLNLIEPSDKGMNDLDCRKIWFSRVIERGMLEQLEMLLGLSTTQLEIEKHVEDD